MKHVQLVYTGLETTTRPTELTLSAAVCTVLILQTTDTGPFTHSAMTDLQVCEFGGSTEKTLWQFCQLVIGEEPGQLRDHTGIQECDMRLCTAPNHRDQLAGT